MQSQQRYKQCEQELHLIIIWFSLNVQYTITSASYEYVENVTIFPMFFFLFLGAITGIISIYTGVDEVYTLHDSLLAVDSVLRYPYFDCGG